MTKTEWRREKYELEPGRHMYRKNRNSHPIMVLNHQRETLDRLIFLPNRFEKTDEGEFEKC